MRFVAGIAAVAGLAAAVAGCSWRNYQGIASSPEFSSM